MVREDLINSAVSFLQDPSVAGAPLEKRIAFLQSKNLTQEEINVSIARAGEPAAAPVAHHPQQQGYVYPQQPPPGYGPYPGYWPQSPPPELPRRDWRDWFIMATVVGGVGFGLYTTAKRYIIPLIAPPTEPQLTQDKAAIDASFAQAFASLTQLETDTQALKDAETSRTARLDAALAELEVALQAVKDADRQRDDDARRNSDELRRLNDALAKGLDSQKSATEARIKELTSELRSLKTLLAGRLGSGAVASGGVATATVNGKRATGEGNGVADASASTTLGTEQPASSDGAVQPGSSKQQSGHSAFPRFGSGKASIPAWQMAAAKKSQENLKAQENSTEQATTNGSVGQEENSAS